MQLFADFRYAEAGAKVPGVEFTITKRAIPRDLAERLSGRIGFEAGTLSYAQYEVLAAGGLDLVPTHGLVEGLRAVKDEDEIARIRAATEVANAAFARFADERVLGRTERELAWAMDTFLHEAGADDNAFPTIVAAGRRTARTRTRRRATGSSRRGSRSWWTRARCSTGTAPTARARSRRGGSTTTCRRRTTCACERSSRASTAVRPGVSGVDADAAARDVIEAAGHGAHFGHGLGHGLGMDVHELPRVSTESTETLAAGNVTSVEPGVYLPGRGGIRIEDLVVVRDGGPEILTSFTKELVTLA